MQVRVALGRLEDRGLVVRIISAPDACGRWHRGSGLCDTRGVGDIPTVYRADRAYLDAYWRARAVDLRNHRRAVEDSLIAIARSREILARTDRVILANEAWWRGL